MRTTAIPTLPILLCTYISSKKSGHFLLEQELLHGAKQSSNARRVDS